MTGCIRCHGPTDDSGNCPICDRDLQNSRAIKTGPPVIIDDSPKTKILEPKLISVTRTIETMTPEESLAYIARVSSPQNQDNHDTAYKLLRHCLTNGHWSVFEMADMTVEVWTSRAIAHQLLRHWSFRVQEFSQRYSEIGLIDWSHVEVREKAVGGNRQGSGDGISDLTHQAKQNCLASEASYRYLLQQGAAPESARMVMPLATPTRLYVKGSVRTWITYLWQRSSISLKGLKAQKEHQVLADGVVPIFESVFPNIAIIAKEGSIIYLTNDEQALIQAHREEKKKDGIARN